MLGEPAFISVDFVDYSGGTACCVFVWLWKVLIGGLRALSDCAPTILEEGRTAPFDSIAPAAAIASSHSSPPPHRAPS